MESMIVLLVLCYIQLYRQNNRVFTVHQDLIVRQIVGKAVLCKGDYAIVYFNRGKLGKIPKPNV